MIKEKLTLRLATTEDCDLLLNWDNDEETCKNAFNTESIPYAIHVKSFNNKLLSNNCNILVF